MLYEKFSFDISSSKTELSISPFPDDRKFLLEITEDVISKGQNRGLIFAAVNDFAVKKFLKKEINFGDIYNLIRDKYDYFEKQEITTIEMLKANTTEIQKTKVSKMSILIGVIVLFLVLVTFHEYGHYSVARYFKIKILKFSIGFGPDLINWKNKDGIKFSLSVPLLADMLRFMTLLTLLTIISFQVRKRNMYWQIGLL